MECSCRRKALRPYEFGGKVSVATTLAHAKGGLRKIEAADESILAAAKAGHKDARVEYDSRAGKLVLVLGAPPGSPAGLYYRLLAVTIVTPEQAELVRQSFDAIWPLETLLPNFIAGFLNSLLMRKACSGATWKDSTSS